MKSKSNRFWALVLGGVLLLCAVSIFYMTRQAAPKGPVAVVYSGGQEFCRIDLGAAEDDSFVVTGLGGLSNTVEVTEGKIRVSHADCPDQVCVMQGWLEDSIIPIACLPSGLVIQMTDAPDTGVDRAVG